jgi:hypothetical protein
MIDQSDQSDKKEINNKTILISQEIVNNLKKVREVQFNN